MDYMQNGNVLIQTTIDTLSNLLAVEAVSTTILLFEPIRIVFLIAWVFLCLYCVQRVEYSPLIASRYKPIASAACLVVGPFLFFILVVADITVKIQDGEIDLAGIFSYCLGSIFHSSSVLGQKKEFDQDFIELLDSSGQDYFSKQAGENRERFSDTEALKKTQSIILNGIRQRASDILIDPKSSGVYTIRYRIDGFLRVIEEIPSETCKAVVNSIKAISGMDIAERRRALDGAFMARINEGNVYFRVASAGVLGGEKLSLRVLNQAQGILALDEIGLSAESYNIIRDAVNQPQGMIVVCGPTGSGKTTSLYAMLNEVDFFTRNVVTVEDPIEYVLPNASQIEVNPKANITFANSLRSILRQDPDIIVVGEIRDAETAAMAIQSSHTGHLVLATLHASSNIATLARFIDLEIKPLVLASALNVVISQRLIRKLCDHCKIPAELTDEQLLQLENHGINPELVMQQNGCKKCGQTGFLGREAIVDVLYMDDNIKSILSSDHLSMGDLKRKGDTKGKSNLRKEGLKKVAQGKTTLEEIKRVTSNLG